MVSDPQKSKTRCIKTPCQNLYVTFVYKLGENNKIDYVRISSKATRFNECGASNFETIADLLTFCIRRIRNKYEAGAIVKALRYHRCNKVFPGKPLSCGDAISKLLIQEFKEIGMGTDE